MCRGHIAAAQCFGHIAGRAVEVSQREVAGYSLERMRMVVRPFDVVAVDCVVQSGEVGIVAEFDSYPLVELLVAAEALNGLVIIHSVCGQ